MDRLTSKVVYDFKSKKYIGVFIKRYMRMWDVDCNDINKIKKIKFNKNINDLFTLNNEETLILYEDGTCESLECALEGRKIKTEDLPDEKDVVKSIINPQLQKISKVAFFTTLKGTLITYFVRNESKKLLELFYFLLEKDTLKINGDISTVKIQRLEQNCKLMAYTVVDGNVFPHLISICKYFLIFFFLNSFCFWQSPCCLRNMRDTQGFSCFQMWH